MDSLQPFPRTHSTTAPDWAGSLRKPRSSSLWTFPLNRSRSRIASVVKGHPPAPGTGLPNTADNLRAIQRTRGSSGSSARSAAARMTLTLAPTGNSASLPTK